MSGKKTAAMIASLCAVAVIFAGITVVVTKTTPAYAVAAEPEGSAAAQPETAEAADSNVEETAAENGSSEGVGGGIEAAEALIGESVSREQIQAKVGEWDKFEMSSNGCERGVYAGRFFYQDFNIYSRTYDKGKTFHVMSVNE